MIKKADIFLFSALLIVSVILLLTFIFFPLENGNTLVITQDGIETHRLSLSEDTTVKIGENLVVIKDGKACMESAVCPDKICVHQGEISKVGEAVVCLPQKIILEVE